MTSIITGRGVFSWPGVERRTDRYGLFILLESVWAQDIRCFVGDRCQITATVLQTRTSGHIGDLFRGIVPTTPDVGETLDLGTGVLFVEQVQDILGVGLVPDDGRTSDWFDPHKLYRLHDQTVELTITVVS